MQAFPQFGCFIKVENGVLLTAPMKLDGNCDHAQWAEVEYAESADFLKAVNEAFGTDFKSSNFFGR